MDPFLKWAGGKRWLISKIDTLFPKNFTFNNYCEPFLGSGAVFFHLNPPTGFLSDLNPNLINVYSVIRDDWAGLLDILTTYHEKHCFDFYYNIRKSAPIDPLYSAARFLYLNRTCWNGLYRVNRNGEFNVPKGTKNNVILETDDFQKISASLKNMDIADCDFELTMDKSKSGDFVFVDPPYTVKHNLNGFLKYNENIFSWNDQVRLKNAILKAKKRGVFILLLNADHQCIKELYTGIGEMTTLRRPSLIAGNSNARGTYSELAIKCW